MSIIFKHFGPVYKEDVEALPILEEYINPMETHLLQAIAKLRESPRAPQSRRLKIRTGWRRLMNTIRGKDYKEFPEILVRGVWLQKYGFSIERHIHVFSFNKVLIICEED